MRITQSMLYSSTTNGMNSILNDYMNTVVQSSTQKRVNSPSDDPMGTVNILKYRASIVSNETYINNSKEAGSWLASTDGALQQAQTILTRLTELAEQSATGTVSPENRMQIASEVQQLFEQLITVANTEYNGTHMFSGHKIESSAYQMRYGIMTENPEFDNVTFDVQGAVGQTAMIRFANDGAIGTDQITYEYSKDAGRTWQTGTLAAGDTVLDLDGCTVNLAEGTPVNVKAYNPDEKTSPTNGSMLYVRPSAEYIGDDNDFPPEVDIYGASISKDTTKTTAHGTFETDIQVKFPEAVSVNQDGTIDYQYSTDNGLTWKYGKATTLAGSDTVRLVLPGGYVDVAAENSTSIDADAQFVVRPNRAEESGYEISDGEFIQITNDGKDIFGGIYKAKGSDYSKPVEEPNIFETISDLLAYCQTDNQDGCGQSVEDLRKVSEHLLTKLAEVGGKSNRVEVNLTVMQTHMDNQTTRMSNIEDADLTELLNRLTQQQTAYQAALKSSSMIMQMSLLDYV